MKYERIVDLTLPAPYSEIEEEKPSDAAPNEVKATKKNSGGAQLRFIQFAICVAAIISVLVIRLFSQDAFVALGENYMELVSHELTADEVPVNSVKAVAAKLEGVLKKTAGIGGGNSYEGALETQITSGYGLRSNPFGDGTEFHSGVDIGCPSKTPVYAPRDGEIVISARNEELGNYIYLDIGEDERLLFAHLFEGAGEGKVRAGEWIAYTGESGKTTGPHLHLEYHKNGFSLPPDDFIDAVL